MQSRVDIPDAPPLSAAFNRQISKFLAENSIKYITPVRSWKLIRLNVHRCPGNAGLGVKLRDITWRTGTVARSLSDARMDRDHWGGIKKIKVLLTCIF